MLELRWFAWCFILCSSIRKDEGAHPRGDGKSAQEAKNKEDRDAPLQKRVRKNIKIKEINRGMV